MRCYSYTETDWSDIILLPATFCLYSVVWEAWLRWSNDKYIQKFIWNQMHLILNHSTKELLKPLFTGTQMSFPTLNSLEYSVGDLLGFRNFWHWIHIESMIYSFSVLSVIELGSCTFLFFACTIRRKSSNTCIFHYLTDRLFIFCENICHLNATQQCFIFCLFFALCAWNPSWY